jgi:lysophospholipase L1-like esterase
MAAAGLVVAAPNASAATTYKYVILGDSLSSGEGTYGVYDPSTARPGVNMCHQSSNAFGAQYAGIFQKDTGDSYNLWNFACSGAGTPDIYTDPNPNGNTAGIPDQGEQAQTQDLSALSDVRLVTVSIGINDLGLLNFAQYCYTQPSTITAENNCFLNIANFNVPNWGNYQTNLTNLPTYLAKAYQAIQAAAGSNATIAVVNYPQIFPTSLEWNQSCNEKLPNGNMLIPSASMLTAARAAVTQLNSAIATAVAAAQAKFKNFILVDESNALVGHELCSTGAADVNQVNYNDGGYPFTSDDESLHPNDNGYLAMAKVLAYRLDAGYFSDGSVEQNIAGAYKANGGLAGIGYPYDNGSGPYVHYWNAVSANVQDYGFGATATGIIVDGQKGAFYVGGGYHAEFVNGGYAGTCGAPTDNAYSTSSTSTRQDFISCYMTQTSGGSVAVHAPPSSCTNYGGGLMTGPNACEGFYTEAPAGQPASGNVWFSGGGVGYLGQEIWTYANGTTATSTAVYNLSGLDNSARAWQLQAYIPNNHSDASHAHYHYCTPDGLCYDGHVNQNNFTNQWATFGDVCTSYSSVQVTLADDGGDPYPEQVGADAIRAVLTGLAC